MEGTELIVPLSVTEAEAFLRGHQRHYRSEGVEAMFAIGLRDAGVTVGAVIVGRMGDAAELLHIYCDGRSEGYTILYGAAWRAAKALGYKTMVL